MAVRNPDDFDGYRKWLGISEKKRPPSHYELLGLALDEDDPDVIRAASQQRQLFVESKRGEGHDAVVAELLYCINEAETTLLDNEMRRDYDREMTLFARRRKNRQVDPYAPRSRVESRPGKSAGEGSDIVRTFVGIMVVICVAFGTMAWFSFQMPWNLLVRDADFVPAPVPQVVVQNNKKLPVQVPVAPAPIPLVAEVVDRPLVQKKELSKTLKNSIGIQLTLIPSGEFLMGSPADEQDRQEDEGPQHRVRITHPFYMGVHEVTKGQFATFVNARNYQTDAERDRRGGAGLNGQGNITRSPKFTWKNGGFPQADDHPVMNVSWNDAMAFCEWLSAQEGKTYRLPTEAQWEYACRAGTTTPFQFGAVNNGTQANIAGNYPYGTQSKGPYLKGTSRVGTYQPNAWGLYDLHGNVFEWCVDGFDEKAYGAHTGTTNDPEVSTDAASRRVFRGGSWFVGAWYSRSANRDGEPPEFRKFTSGFRVVRTP